MTDIFLAIGDMVESTFAILPALGNGANTLFIVTGFTGALYWIGRLMNAEKEEV